MKKRKFLVKIAGDFRFYKYDSAHNQLTKEETINGVYKGITSYTYDVLNRLETVSEPNQRKTVYTFDASGNRKTETITEGQNTTVNVYFYDGQNRLTGITTTLNGTNTQTTTYEYDNNGNQTKTLINGEVTVTNVYDKLNQLIKTISEGTTVENEYNGEGYRVEKTVNGFVTRYLYEYDKVVLEVDGNGNQTGRNIYGTNLLMRSTEGQSYYYMYNGHADVTALINVTTGHVDATYYYDAFGNIIESTGDVNNNITYAGYQYDKETELYYLNARMYDPKIARFLQEDTYRGEANDPLSLNLYTYCLNNPLVYWDPTGNVAANVQFGDYTYKTGDYTDGTTTVTEEEFMDDRARYSLYLAGFENFKLDEGMIVKGTDGKRRVKLRAFSESLGIQDTISYWTDDSETMNVIVRPESKYAPVKVVRNEDEIKINAYLDIVGDAALDLSWEENSKRLRERANNYKQDTFYNLVKEGFRLWNGDYTIDKQSVHVNVNIIDKRYDAVSSNQNFLKIEIMEPKDELFASQQDKLGQSYVKPYLLTGWSAEKPAKYMRLYSGTLFNGIMERDPWDVFKGVAAHEFGHVLGVSDAYNLFAEQTKLKQIFNPGRRDAPESVVPKNDIMRCGSSGYSVTNYDVKAMFEAYRTNTFFNIPEKNNNAGGRE